MASNEDERPASPDVGTPADCLSTLFQSVKLPCGLIIPNRLVKAATYEHLASLFGGPPTDAHCALYAQWAAGNWGMLITGNVQVVPDHLTLGRDIVLPRSLDAPGIAPFRALERSAHRYVASGSKALVIMQLSHAGRQSPSVLGGRPLFLPAAAPSAIPLGRKATDRWFARVLYRIMFPTPRELTLEEIDYILERFVHGARVAAEAGFDGVELHAAHGYLLAQFLSPKSNVRDDCYSAGQMLLLQRIVREIRKTAPQKFVVGVKISSADFVEAGSHADKSAEARALTYVKEIAEWSSIDFIEISGGDYENPEFMLSARQVFFARFARLARAAIQNVPESRRPLILLTGGLRTKERLQDALINGHADLLGLARAATLSPHFPLRLAGGPSGPPSGGDPLVPPEPKLEYPDAPMTRLFFSALECLGILPLPKLIGAGVGMAWYTVMLHRLSKGKTADYSIGGAAAVMLMWTPELRVVALAVLICVAIVSWSWASRDE
ncbi:hypothetical protein K488DRAFT_43257 [Vararia minispora EC-137]|uniref:Uncharacterized protein n=1 Tax=Vararia minispora EC-137 TaxID=1314806 RepID=A0ACB8QUD0_9AGAM|nr:hypothetical protein K488DRAFT_43257 [Vararia minispora EC-137]